MNIALASDISDEEDTLYFRDLSYSKFWYLSNDYESPMMIDGIKFYTIAQYMLYRKYIFSGDTKSASIITKMRYLEFYSHYAKIRPPGISRSIHLFEGIYDTTIKYSMVLRVVMIKFLTNKELADKLINLPYDELVYINGDDTILGTCRDDVGKGENYLGKALCETRDIIRKMRGFIDYDSLRPNASSSRRGGSNTLDNTYVSPPSYESII